MRRSSEAACEYYILSSISKMTCKMASVTSFYIFYIYITTRNIAEVIILHTKITAAQNEVAFSYHKVRGLYFLAAIFGATISGSTFIKAITLFCVKTLIIIITNNNYTHWFNILSHKLLCL